MERPALTAPAHPANAASSIRKKDGGVLVFVSKLRLLEGNNTFPAEDIQR